MLAEFIGTALLLAAVVGSGIMADRLSPNDVGLKLLENSTATGAALVAIILAVGPVSGAHLNPAVTVADWVVGGVDARRARGYVVAQLSGAVAGTITANLMFGRPVLELSSRVRFGPGLWLGEAVATFGLLLVIFGVVRSGRSGLAPFAVGAYIAAAYWFTSSTSFANPAVTIAREFSNTFAGVAPGSVLPFVLAQAVGTGVAIAAVKALYPRIHEVAERAVVPHQEAEPAPQR